MSFESRLVLPFWYRLTQVLLEKRQLNGCSVVLETKDAERTDCSRTFSAGVQPIDHVVSRLCHRQLATGQRHQQQSRVCPGHTPWSSISHVLLSPATSRCSSDSKQPHHCCHRKIISVHGYIPHTSQWAGKCLQCFDAVGWAAGRASGL